MNTHTAALRRQGFDKSEKVRGETRWRVRCSQCRACTINGTPCHERGCPNEKR